MELNRFYEFIHKQIGLDRQTVGTALFERVIRERVKLFGQLQLPASQDLPERAEPDQLEQYWQFVQRDKAEHQALIEAMVIPETSFFRHADSYVLLAAQVQSLIARFPARTIRLLSLPCSTGEEPYSMVMTLLDAGVAPQRLSLLAVDISQTALQVAKKGVYGRNSFRNGRRDLRARYFEMDTDGRYAVTPEVKKMVRFTAGNLLNAGLMADEAPFDIIFCRNVLIYFDRDTQIQVLKKCRALLSSWGVLFVAPAEGPLLVANGFRQTGHTGAFAYVPDTAEEACDNGISATSRTASRFFSPPVPLTRAIPPSKLPSPGKNRLPESPVINAGGVAVSGIQNGAQIHEDSDNHDNRNSHFSQASTLADLGQFENALLHCDTWLARHGTDHAAWLLKGIIHDAMGQIEAALTAYRKTLYLEPNHEEALAHMAELFRQQGDLPGALRLSRRLERIQKYNQRLFSDTDEQAGQTSRLPEQIVTDRNPDHPDLNLAEIRPDTMTPTGQRSP